MPRKLITLKDIPQAMIIAEHPSGVVYRNQVGGVVCWQAEVEGVLAPLDVSDDVADRIAAYPYPSGREGITEEIADTIDALLTSEPGAKHLTVDRARLAESWEAWIYVLIDSPEYNEPSLSEPYFGPFYGFGKAKGVLTWRNSD